LTGENAINVCALKRIKITVGLFFWLIRHSLIERIPLIYWQQFVSFPQRDGQHFLRLQRYDGQQFRSLQLYDGQHFLSLKRYDGQQFRSLQLYDGQHFLSLKRYDGQQFRRLQRCDGQQFMNLLQFLVLQRKFRLLRRL
jgi:hypothetical protein